MPRNTYAHTWVNEHTLCVIFTHETLAHIIKEHVDTIGAGLLDGCIQRRDCLVIVGSIKPNALEILHFLVTTSKTFVETR